MVLNWVKGIWSQRGSQGTRLVHETHVWVTSDGFILHFLPFFSFVTNNLNAEDYTCDFGLGPKSQVTSRRDMLCSPSVQILRICGLIPWLDYLHQLPHWRLQVQWLVTSSIICLQSCDVITGPRWRRWAPTVLLIRGKNKKERTKEMTESTTYLFWSIPSP